jgi:hypothetical protein
MQNVFITFNEMMSYICYKIYRYAPKLFQNWDSILVLYKTNCSNCNSLTLSLWNRIQYETEWKESAHYYDIQICCQGMSPFNNCKRLFNILKNYIYFFSNAGTSMYIKFGNLYSLCKFMLSILPTPRLYM